MRWIEAALPEIDSVTFGPWLAQPPTHDAITAVVHVRVESASRPPQSITVALSAYPTAGDHSSR
ncbi:hypothetical protein KHQ06_24650 [Nocardia tengchongensis]|uniref:DnaA N-terminal domain-containing protein n=1 Tax=Nocardia tengchongensis TaxID=2055889 RepID=A0ABX8CHW1_9NOCA|nr:hypothetical protein [Nocardia tengchongensis]QVI19551.1 hypothetical protein KHQ06_24650 [Nocardia tengchongensis]